MTSPIERLTNMIEDFEDTYGCCPSADTIDQWRWQISETPSYYDEDEEED